MSAFIIYDVERTFDERVCRNEQDVRDTINGALASRLRAVSQP